MILDQIPQGVMFDIDGTLTESKQPLDDNMAELLAALLMRLPVAVITGASMHQIETQFLPRLPKSTSFSQLYLFPSSGAQGYIYTKNAWQANYSLSLTEQEKIEIINAIAKVVPESKCTEGRKIYGKQIEDREASIALSLLGQDAPLNEKESFDPKREIRLSLVEKLSPMLPEFELRIGGMTTIDITKKGISKAYAVEQFASYLNVPAGRLLYVGDALDENGNDSAVLTTSVATWPVRTLDDTRDLIKRLTQN